MNRNNILRLVGIVSLLFVIGIAGAQISSNPSSGDFLVWEDYEDGFSGISQCDEVVEYSYEDTYSCHYNNINEQNDLGIDASTNSNGSFYARVYTGDDGAGKRIEIGPHEVRLHFNDQSGVTDYNNITLEGDTVLDRIENYEANQWYNIYWTYNSDAEHEIYLWNPGEPMPETPSLQGQREASGDVTTIYIYGDPPEWYIDEIGSGEASSLSGVITERNGGPVANATVELSQNGSVESTDTTGEDGAYSVGGESGIYNVTIQKEGYQTITDTVALTGSITKDYELVSFDQVFQFNAPHWMEHGSQVEYRAKFDSGETYLQDVTGNVSVSSANTTIVTVDESNNTLHSTDDRSVNNQTYLDISFTHENETFNTTHDITVANRTIDNIEVMPSGQWIPTVLGFGEDGTAFGIGSEIQYVLLVVFIGAGASWFARNEWVGIGVIEALMVLLWVLGHVGLGITMVSTFYALFAGYQLNKIPSRSDTNVQPGAVDQVEQPPNE